MRADIELLLLNRKNSLRELEVDCASRWVFVQLVLWETFLVQRHLGVVMLLAQEGLQMSVYKFGRLHGLKSTNICVLVNLKIGIICHLANDVH